jgi:serine/threonine protein kinase
MTAVSSPDLVGRYAVYGRIASGGTATVHVGRLRGAIGFSRIVAIKRLHPHLAEDPEFLSTMIDEARLASRIHHPNVVSTLDVVAVERELLLVMDYVRGESLARLLRLEMERERRVPLQIASAIVIGALHGLHAAHEAVDDHGTPLGIVHRDVSPQNILVGTDGIPRVIDFGIAKAAGRIQTTREGVLKGKMAYMAPEQLEGRDATRRTDVYAMAVVLWETLVGRRLFRADNDAQLVVRILSGVTDPPSREVPGITPALDALVMKGLSPRPEDRFASARDMAEMLMRVVPPAFPTSVGAWVEEVARDRLELHGTMLAEIEASTGPRRDPVPVSAAEVASAVRATRRDGMPELPQYEEDPPTSVTQPSKSATATSLPPVPVTSRFKLTSAIVMAAMVVGGITGVALRGTRAAPRNDAQVPAAALSIAVPASSPPALPSAPLIGTAAASGSSPASSGSTRPPSSGATHPMAAPARPRPRPQAPTQTQPAPTSTGSIRFTQPD